MTNLREIPAQSGNAIKAAETASAQAQSMCKSQIQTSSLFWVTKKARPEPKAEWKENLKEAERLV
jgi:hypothetical protein